MNTTTVNTDAEAMASSLTTVQTAVAGFDKIAAGIAALHAEHPVNLVADPSTKDGMATLTAGYKAWRAPRLELEKKRKEAKAPVNALAKNIDAFAGQLEKELRAGEDNYYQQIEAYKAEQARIAEEAKKRDDERKEKHQKAIATIRSYAILARGLPSARIAAGVEKLEAMRFGAEWEEFAALAVIAQTETLEALRQMLTQATQAEAEAEALRIKQQADDEAREAQRLENERVAAQLKAQQDAIEAQQRELKRQQDEINAQRAAMATPPAAAKSAEQAAQADVAAGVTVADALDEALAGAREVIARKLGGHGAGVASNAPAPAAPAPAPGPTEEPTMKLGDVNDILGAGIKMTEEFVTGTLGVPKAENTVGRAVMFRPSQLNTILEALAEHALARRRG